LNLGLIVEQRRHQVEGAEHVNRAVFDGEDHGLCDGPTKEHLIQRTGVKSAGGGEPANS
jgi:hypothetical protein